jgi:hypothetical protein
MLPLSSELKCGGSEIVLVLYPHYKAVVRPNKRESIFFVRCLYAQAYFLCLYTSTLKLEIPRSSELSILFHSITRFNNPEDPDFSHNQETTKVCSMVVQFEFFFSKGYEIFCLLGIKMCCLMKINRHFDGT